MTPLVSILIPAYNAEASIAYTLESAIAQTWPRTEIIVVDDGSRDRTAEVARRFASKKIAVVSLQNRGQSAAVNHAYRLCQGDYIQELDADDLLAPDKIEKQIAALRESFNPRILLSSSMAFFYYRNQRARFIETPLCENLSPVEWLLRKLGQKLHMQNATWLVSRDLAEAAGPWNEELAYDQDGEYFARVLVKCEGTRFVPATGVYYRHSGLNRISYVGNSDKKKDSLLLSMKLHIQYLRSLEESDRVRKACLTYLQNYCIDFYPERPDIIEEMHRLAASLQGSLELPRLRWKYAWMRPVFGWDIAKRAQTVLPEIKASLSRYWDKTMFQLEAGKRLRGA
jgi:glycosyltransferase involved in cell wall biosynthesis